MHCIMGSHFACSSRHAMYYDKLSVSSFRFITRFIINRRLERKVEFCFLVDDSSLFSEELRENSLSFCKTKFAKWGRGGRERKRGLWLFLRKLISIDCRNRSSKFSFLCLLSLLASMALCTQFNVLITSINRERSQRICLPNYLFIYLASAFLPITLKMQSDFSISSLEICLMPVLLV